MLPTGLLDTKETNTSGAPKTNRNTNNFSIEAILGIKPPALKSNFSPTVHPDDSIAKETDKTKPVEKATSFQNTDFQTEAEKRRTDLSKPETRNPRTARFELAERF